MDLYCLEAFPVNNRRSTFIILLLGDPHLLEGGKRSQNRSSNPDRVFPLRRSNDLDLDCGRSQGSDFLLHPISNTGVHGSTTRHDSVGIQVLPNVNITFHDGVVGSLMNTTRLIPKKEGWKRASGARNLSLPMVMT